MTALPSYPDIGTHTTGHAAVHVAVVASASPLGVMVTRAASRLGLVEKLKSAMDCQKKMRGELRLTEDFQEGIAASSARRKPEFKGC